MKNLKLGALTFVFLLLAGGFAMAQVSAQQERPLAESALRKTDFAPGIILTHGPLKDEAHPLNSYNGARVREFQSGYSFSGVNDELEFAHYLYRFKNAQEAREQAQHFWDSAKSEKAKPLMPELSLDTLLAKDDSGTTIRVTDPETGGYCYWYVATRGRDLSLLMICGAPNAQTLAQFNQYKNIASHR
jgi:hypothetical protein